MRIKDLKIKSKLISAFLILSLLPLIVLTIISIINVRKELEYEAFTKLNAIQKVKKNQISDYFDEIKSQMRTFSNDEMIRNAAIEFTRAFFNIEAEIGEEFESSWQTYENRLRNRYTYQVDNTPGSSPSDIEKWYPENKFSQILQFLYISENTHKIGEKEKLMSANDNSSYSRLHQLYHPIISQYLSEFGYYDIFIIEPQTGYIVYSVFKEVDYATSLFTGPYKNTNFAKAVQKAMDADKMNDIFLEDFKLYPPSYNDPASFIASPVYDQGELIAVLAFQMPMTKISAIMTQREGFRESEETYLIGPDNLMRSDSYLDPTHRSVVASFRNPEKGKVETLAAQKALKGESGKGIIIDYNGNPVLSVYNPLNISGLHWAIIAEIDKAEAFQSIQKLTILIMGIWIAATLLVVVAAVFIAGSISKPIVNVTEILKDIAQGEGDLTKRIHHDRKDEIGQLAYWFNTFIEKLNNIILQVRNNTNELATAANEINATTTQIATGAEEQSSQATEVSTSVQEMSATIVENSTNATQTAEMTEQASSKVNEGNEMMQSTLKSMEDIVNKVSITGNLINSLSERATDIDTIIQVINEIADQTNLLALNAAIEAARAGDQGRGFAVVADEVRKLAERTTKATGEIGEKIVGIQNDTKDASTSMSSATDVVIKGQEMLKQMAEILNEILKRVTQSLDMIQQIAAASEEESAGAEQISRNIESIAEVTRQTAYAVEESSKTADELNIKSENLQQIVVQFKLDDSEN